MIMNIESFNISKNVLYKLINKINPDRFRSIAGGLALLSILALPGCSLLEPEKMPPKPANPTGVSGKHDPQAEQLFAKAHVLWKGETCTDPEKALEYLGGIRLITPYRVIWVAAVFTGCVSKIDLVWVFADCANGLMALPNLISLLALSGVLVQQTRYYLWQHRLDDYDDSHIPEGR